MKNKYALSILGGILALIGVYLPWIKVPLMGSLSGIDLIYNYDIRLFDYIPLVVIPLLAVALLVLSYMGDQYNLGGVISFFGIALAYDFLNSAYKVLPKSLYGVIGVGPKIVIVGFALSLLESFYFGIKRNREKEKERIESLHKRMREDYLIEKQLEEIEGSLYETDLKYSERHKPRAYKKEATQGYGRKNHADEFDIDLTISEEENKEDDMEDFLLDDESRERGDREIVADEKDEIRYKKKKAVAKLCPNCGKRILLNSKFCPYCGYVFKK